VISLCDRVREVCPEFPGSPETIHWSIPDPAAAGGSDEETYPVFGQIAADLRIRIGFLLGRIGEDLGSGEASGPGEGPGPGGEPGPGEEPGPGGEPG
jgi:hypothetical protein